MATTPLTDETFDRIVAQLTFCPTCSKALERKPGTSLFVCPDRYHGAFAVVWSQTDRRYHVSYQVKGQAR